MQLKSLVTVGILRLFVYLDLHFELLVQKQCGCDNSKGDLRHCVTFQETQKAGKKFVGCDGSEGLG